MFWFGLVTGSKQWVLSHWVYRKRKKNLKLFRSPNHSTTALAYVGSGRGREAIQKMVMRERERATIIFFVNLERLSYLRGKFSTFWSQRVKSYLRYLKKKSLNILSNNIYNILNSMMQQSIFNFKNSKVSEWL